MRCRGINQRARGRHRVQADVHGLQARRTGGDRHVPGNRRRLDGLTWRLSQRRSTAWTTDLRFEDIPADVVDAAKLHLLDTLGCGLAAHALGIATEGRSTMAELGGDGQSTVIGHGGGMPAPNAAFANAMLCHGLDFDDTHSDSVSHVSTVICPAALAAGEAQGSTGREALTAVVASNEVVMPPRDGCVGPLPQARLPPDRDLRRSSARTTAAARLGGLDAATATSALGLVGSMASGVFAYLDDGTADEAPSSGLGCAWGAHRRAARRITGLSGPQSDPRGQVRPLPRLPRRRAGRDRHRGPAGRPRVALGDTAIAYKPFPVCHFMHGSLGAAAQATAGRVFSAAEIADVRRHGACRRRLPVLEPSEQKRVPRSEYEGKFSLQYSAARDARPWHMSRVCRLLRRGDLRSGGARCRRARCATRRRTTPPIRGRSRGACVVTLGEWPRARGRLSLPEGRPREPVHGRRDPREVPRQRIARTLGRRARGARRGRPLDRGSGRPRGGSRASSPPPRSPPDRACGSHGGAAGNRCRGRRVRRPRSRSRLRQTSSMRDEFPETLVEQMREMGLFGATIPEEYGGLGLRSTPTRSS